MQTYNVNYNKRKKALKQVVKTNVKTSKGLVKFCYGLTIFLRILSIILGVANILYVFLLSDYLVDIIFLIITFGVPYSLSFLPATVYIMSVGGEYRLRKQETVTLNNGGFVYSYHDDRVGLSDTIFAFNVFYEKIDTFRYDEKTGILTLRGIIVGDTYENGDLKNSIEFNEISLLDVYDVSIKQLLEKNC